MDNIFNLHGMPHSIVSDIDAIFTSNFSREFFRLPGTQLQLNTSHHPQIDGQNEAINKYLEIYWCFFAYEMKTQWVQWFSLDEWWSTHLTIQLLT
jgi:hypothetical protein